jgi:hypothetical protein
MAEKVEATEVDGPVEARGSAVVPGEVVVAGTAVPDEVVPGVGVVVGAAACSVAPPHAVKPSTSSRDDEPKITADTRAGLIFRPMLIATAANSNRRRLGRPVGTATPGDPNLARTGGKSDRTQPPYLGRSTPQVLSV